MAIFPPSIFFFPLPKKTRLPLAPVASVSYLYLKPTLLKAACHPRCWDFGERIFPLHCVSSVGCVAGKRRTFRGSAPHTPGFHALHGRRGGMVVLSQPLPGPRSLFTGPPAPGALEFTRSLAGPPGCSLPRRRPLGWLSPPLPPGSPSSVLQGQAGGQTGARLRSPRASGSAERLRTPAGSEEEEGASPRTGGGVRRPAWRVQGRWIPGKTKALRDLRIPDKPRGKPPWSLAV